MSKQLPWLAAFGFVSGATSWIDMFLASGSIQEYTQLLTVLRMITQPLSGLLLIIFAWEIEGPGTLSGLGHFSARGSDRSCGLCYYICHHNLHYALTN